MMHILKCESCGTYGLSNKCECGYVRERVVPPKFSPEDKYAKYRRQAKKEMKNVEK